MLVSANAPCRVDLAGATLDIWPLYLFHDNVVTVNFAVDRYTSCDIATNDEARITLRSRDLALESMSEAPAGAGISGSSALMISVAAALNKLTGRKYTIEKLREIVQNV